MADVGAGTARGPRGASGPIDSAKRSAQRSSGARTGHDKRETTTPYSGLSGPVRALLVSGLTRSLPWSMSPGICVPGFAAVARGAPGSQTKEHALPPTPPLELALPGCARRIRLMVWPQIREGALARHCHFRFAKGAGRWTSVWASLRERGKAKRPPHVGPGKVVLPPVSPKELGSDLPRPKKDARQPVILRRLLVPRARRLWLTPQPEPGGEANSSGYTLGTPAFRPIASSSSIQSGSAAANLFFVPKQRTARSDDR